MPPDDLQQLAKVVIARIEPLFPEWSGKLPPPDQFALHPRIWFRRRHAAGLRIIVITARDLKHDPIETLIERAARSLSKPPRKAKK